MCKYMYILPCDLCCFSLISESSQLVFPPPPCTFAYLFLLHLDIVNNNKTLPLQFWQISGVY